jgi:hypothetical protein
MDIGIATWFAETLSDFDRCLRLVIQFSPDMSFLYVDLNWTVDSNNCVTQLLRQIQFRCLKVIHLMWSIVVHLLVKLNLSSSDIVWIEDYPPYYCFNRCS